MLTLCILYQSYAYLIIAMQCDVFYCGYIYAQLINGSLNPNYFSSDMPKCNILGFDYWGWYGFLIFTTLRHKCSIQKEVVIHDQLSIFWVSSKATIYKSY